MTSNQIAFAQLQEEKRHNLANEKLTKYANKAQAKHLKAQDVYTAEHYKTSDTSGATSANAAAMNAQAASTNAATNRLNYEMQYDIEYGWPKVDTYYWENERKQFYDSGYGPYPLSGLIKFAQGYQEKAKADNAETRVQLENAEIRSSVLKNVGGAGSSVLNAVFGKSGILGALTPIVQ